MVFTISSLRCRITIVESTAVTTYNYMNSLYFFSLLASMGLTIPSLPCMITIAELVT